MGTTSGLSALGSQSWLQHSTRPLHRFLRLSSEEASFRTREFDSADPSKQLALELVGRTFIDGYNEALAAARPEDVARHVHRISPHLRGFAIEGSAMGCAIADMLPFRKQSFVEHLRIFERDFSYLTHVGAGWALARVPWRRAKILAPLNPIHHWLAYDGLGFHDTYFFHRGVLAGWRRRQPSAYAARAYDQGVGRALWFVAGGSVERAILLIAAFAASRQADLWSGLGLAVTYAGPIDADETSMAVAAAGAHRTHFAQGIAFACEARALARHVPPNTELVARTVFGVGADELSVLVRNVRAGLCRRDTGEPPYELWRQGVTAATSRMLERRS